MADKGRASGAAMADEYGAMNSDGYTHVTEELILESRVKMRQVETRYKTWGTLNASGDNCVVVCHALTGNANLEAWWGSLLGPDKPLNTSTYFIFCANVLGSCYGSTGATSINPDTGRKYGGDFPVVTIRDMVRVQANVLKDLGVKELVSAIGGSMGGMQALEWATSEYLPIRSVVSLCASGRHQAWQIGISECQRQAIFADPLWENGQYSDDAPPAKGMAVARMMAMLTYRSHPAYWTKFGRGTANGQKVFDVENYLRHQGQRFNERGFDAATYVALTKSMDTHDLAHGRGDYLDVLRSIKVPTLVASISSDVLYPVSDQLELAKYMPNANHHLIYSDEGHDGFLLEHQHVGTLIRGFLAQVAPVASAAGAEKKTALTAAPMQIAVAASKL